MKTVLVKGAPWPDKNAPLEKKKPVNKPLKIKTVELDFFRDAIEQIENIKRNKK